MPPADGGREAVVVRRVTMTDARRQAIYDAVSDEVMAVRVNVQMNHRAGKVSWSTEQVDELLRKVAMDAGQAAIRAAVRAAREGGGKDAS